MRLYPQPMWRQYLQQKVPDVGGLQTKVPGNKVVSTVSPNSKATTIATQAWQPCSSDSWQSPSFLVAWSNGASAWIHDLVQELWLATQARIPSLAILSPAQRRCHGSSLFSDM
ncbi:hypothetical protein ABPG77_007760 [Micractinium sp. CCAP 211/92]